MHYVIMVIAIVLIYLYRKWGENKRHTGQWGGGTRVMHQITVLMFAFFWLVYSYLVVFGVI